MPVSISEPGTCPPSCAFYGAGCYASYGPMRHAWQTTAARGLAWDGFLAKVRALPPGRYWRHNEAGDLAGAGGHIHWARLGELVAANVGRCGFTYTHKPVLGPAHAANRNALRMVAQTDFVVNLSADGLGEVDRLVRARCGPVVVTVAADAVVPDRTRGGHKLVPCPAQTHGMTCLDCRLCAQPGRQSVVVFRAHGQAAGLVGELVRRKRGSA